MFPFKHIWRREGSDVINAANPEVGTYAVKIRGRGEGHRFLGVFFHFLKVNLGVEISIGDPVFFPSDIFGVGG